MEESCRKGLANHLDPESCVASREAAIEALTGAHAGRVLSCEIIATGVPTSFRMADQLLLRERERLFPHQSWHWDLNPLRARPFVSTNVTARPSLPLTERTRDTLPGPLLGFA